MSSNREAVYMKGSVFAFVILAVVAGFAVAAPFTAPITDLTIYNNNIAYVMRSGNVGLGAGENMLQIVNFSNSADMGSLDIFGTGFGVDGYKRYFEQGTAMRFLTMDELMEKAVGISVTVVTDKGQESGKLVWHTSGFVGLQENNGQVSIYKIDDIRQLLTTVGQYQVQDSTVVSQGLELDLSSQNAANANVGLEYLDSGASWNAVYRIRLSSDSGSGTANVAGYAQVQNNMGEDWKNASLNVVVGSPYVVSNIPIRYYANSKDSSMMYASGAAAMPAPANIGVSTSTVSNYYVYGIDRKMTVLKGEEASVPLLSSSMNYVRENIWDTGMQYPQRVLLFNNTANAPLADGVANVYLGTEFLGQAMVGFAGIGNEVKLAYAAMPEFSVKRDLGTNSTLIGNEMVTDYAGNLTIRNGGTSAQEIVVHEQMAYGDQVQLVNSDVPSKVLAGNIIEWRVSVPAGVEKDISFVYRTTSFEQQPVVYYPAPAPMPAASSGSAGLANGK